mgnify:FL=1
MKTINHDSVTFANPRKRKLILSMSSEDQKWSRLRYDRLNTIGLARHKGSLCLEIKNNMIQDLTTGKIRDWASPAFPASCLSNNLDFTMSWPIGMGMIHSEPRIAQAEYSMLKRSMKMIDKIKNKIARIHGWSTRAVDHSPFYLTKDELAAKKTMALKNPYIVMEALEAMGFVHIRNDPFGSRIDKDLAHKLISSFKYKNEIMSMRGGLK